MVLWILSRFVGFHIRGFHPLWQVFPGPFYYPIQIDYTVRTPSCKHNGLGSSAFARRYWRNHFCFLFLRLLRWFSSPGSPHNSSLWYYASLHNGLPHSDISRSSVAQHLPEAFRSLPRPSSPVETKASPMHSYILPLFTVFFFLFSPPLSTYLFFFFAFFFLSSSFLSLVSPSPLSMLIYYLFKNYKN